MKNPREPAATAKSPSGYAVADIVRFDARERRFLLRQRGISEGVLAGLEALGVGSLDQLAAIGADELCRRMHATHGWDVWGNRRRMLHAAIEAAAALATTVDACTLAPPVRRAVRPDAWRAVASGLICPDPAAGSAVLERDRRRNR